MQHRPPLSVYQPPCIKSSLSGSAPKACSVLLPLVRPPPKERPPPLPAEEPRTPLVRLSPKKRPPPLPGGAKEPRTAKSAPKQTPPKKRPPPLPAGAEEPRTVKSAPKQTPFKQPPVPAKAFLPVPVCQWRSHERPHGQNCAYRHINVSFAQDQGPYPAAHGRESYAESPV